MSTPVHGRTMSNIPALYPLDARSTTPISILQTAATKCVHIFIFTYISMYIYTSTSCYPDLFGFRIQIAGIQRKGCYIIGIFDSCLSFQIANSRSSLTNSSSKRLYESILSLSWNSVWITRVDSRDVCMYKTICLFMERKKKACVCVYLLSGKMHRELISSGCHEEA